MTGNLTYGQMAQLAMKLPTPATLLVPLKAIHACREVLRMPQEDCARIMQSLDVQALIKACDDNRAIQIMRQEGRETWRDMTVNPCVRVEFDTAIIYGSIGEAVSLASSKSWGKSILSIKPLEPRDALHPERITYTLKAESPMRQRWEWRDNFKRILRPHARIVNDAMRYGKAVFLNKITRADTDILRRKLNLPPDQFWVACRHGERFGPNGFARFFQELEERQSGMSFDFGNDLVQIQL